MTMRIVRDKLHTHTLKHIYERLLFCVHSYILHPHCPKTKTQKFKLSACSQWAYKYQSIIKCFQQLTPHLTYSQILQICDQMDLL